MQETLGGYAPGAVELPEQDAAIGFLLDQVPCAFLLLEVFARDTRYVHDGNILRQKLRWVIQGHLQELVTAAALIEQRSQVDEKPLAPRACVLCELFAQR